MVQDKIIMELKEVEFASIMVDVWTDRKGRPFVGLCLGYVSADFDNKVLTLSGKIVEKHTANALAKHIVNELKSYDCAHIKYFLAPCLVQQI